MNDNSQQIDVEAIGTQIAMLKQQRNAAYDDIAVLVGQVQSLKKQLEQSRHEIQNKLDATSFTETEEASAAPLGDKT